MVGLERQTRRRQPGGLGALHGRDPQRADSRLLVRWWLLLRERRHHQRRRRHVPHDVHGIVLEAAEFHPGRGKLVQGSQGTSLIVKHWYVTKEAFCARHRRSRGPRPLHPVSGVSRPSCLETPPCPIFGSVTVGFTPYADLQIFPEFMLRG